MKNFTRKFLSLTILSFLLLFFIILISCKKEEVNHSPVISSISTDPTISGSFDAVEQGKQVLIEVFASDPDNDNLTYSWSYETGSIDGGNTGNIIHYITPIYEEQEPNTIKFAGVTVEVSDGKLTTTDIVSIPVYAWGYDEGEAPVASFYSNLTELSVGDYSVFHDNSTNSPTSWYWSFGDGETSTEQNPNHKYSTAGTYTVSLTVSNDFGSDTKTKSNYITVKESCNTPTLSFPSSTITGIDCGETYEIDVVINSYSSESNITQCGIVWSTTEQFPTIDDNYSVFEGTISSSGEFTGTLENCEPNTKYYFRPYAKNSCGIGYRSASSTFTTENFNPDDCESNNSQSTIVSLRPKEEEYWTGYVNCFNYNKRSGEIKLFETTECYDYGWIGFDISELPSQIEITSIKLEYYINETEATNEDNKIYFIDMNVNPIEASGYSIVNDLVGDAYYLYCKGSATTTGRHETTNWINAAVTNLEEAVSRGADAFFIGIIHDEYVEIDGYDWGGDPEPILTITYVTK